MFVEAPERVIAGVPLEPKLKALVSAQVLKPLPALTVANEVLGRNTALENPLNFVRGESTDLAVQLTFAPRRGKADRIVFGRSGHSRSVILTSNVAIPYRDATIQYVDAKGTGFIDEVERERFHPERQASEYRLKPSRTIVVNDSLFGTAPLGAFDNFDVNSEITGIQKLESIGVRTVPWLAKVAIDEIINRVGRRWKIDSDGPYSGLSILFRGWVTPFRLSEVAFDLEDYPYETEAERKRVIVRTAVEDMLQNDSSIPSNINTTPDGIKNYLEWLARTFGQQVGIMHANRYQHGNLITLHNITLDARIVDADTVLSYSTFGPWDEYIDNFYKDGPFYELILRGIPQLFELDINPDRLIRIARDAYRKKTGASSEREVHENYINS